MIRKRAICLFLLMLAVISMMTACVRKIEEGVISVPIQETSVIVPDVPEKDKGIALILSDETKKKLGSTFSKREGFVFVSEGTDTDGYDAVITESGLASSQGKDLLIEDLMGTDGVLKDICDMLRNDLDRRSIYSHCFVMRKGDDEDIVRAVEDYCSERNIIFLTVDGADELDSVFEGHPEGFAYIAADREETLFVRERMTDRGMQHLVSLFSLEWDREIDTEMRKVMVYGSVILDEDALVSRIMEKVYGETGDDRAPLRIITRENIDSEEILSIKERSAGNDQ